MNWTAGDASRPDAEPQPLSAETFFPVYWSRKRGLSPRRKLHFTFKRIYLLLQIFLLLTSYFCCCLDKVTKTPIEAINLWKKNTLSWVYVWRVRGHIFIDWFIDLLFNLEAPCQSHLKKNIIKIPEALINSCRLLLQSRVCSQKHLKAAVQLLSCASFLHQWELSGPVSKTELRLHGRRLHFALLHQPVKSSKTVPIVSDRQFLVFLKINPDNTFQIKETQTTVVFRHST